MELGRDRSGGGHMITNDQHRRGGAENPRCRLGFATRGRRASGEGVPPTTHESASAGNAARRTGPTSWRW
jgi:hypothetical protein